MISKRRKFVGRTSLNMHSKFKLLTKHVKDTKYNILSYILYLIIFSIFNFNHFKTLILIYKVVYVKIKYQIPVIKAIEFNHKLLKTRITV